MTMHALLFERANHALDHPVLLCAVQRDELLAQAVTAHHDCVVAARKDQAVVASQQERLGRPSECGEPGDQRMLQRA